MRVGILVLVVLLSGCLANDIWREPFQWEEHPTVGASPDAAQAFAGAIEGAGDRAQDEGDVVVGTADDVPDNVAFQNLRDFLNQQEPGSGDQVHENTTATTGQVRDGYLTLTGPAAQAYGEAMQPLDDAGGFFSFEVPDRTTRVRIDLDMLLAQADQASGFHIVLRDAAGAVILDQEFTQSRHYQDMVVEGTYGHDNEVREHLGGRWTAEVSAYGEGAWSLSLSTFEPEHDDYEWWQFWRGAPREVTA